MKRAITIISAICLLASCAKDVLTVPVYEDLVDMDFRAAFDEVAQTKAALTGTPSDDVRSLVWSADDSIMVSNGAGTAKFRNSVSASANAVFKGSIAYGKEYYAAYPYSKSTSFSGGAFNVEIPQVQKYYKDGVDPNALLMVAKGVDGEFRFKNICGIVVVNIKGEGEVKSLTFSAVNSEGSPIRVSGMGKVMMNYANTPTLTMDSSASSSITLNCLDSEGRGVQLTEAGTSFHFVLPAGQYSSFTVRVRLTNDSMKKTSVNPMTVKRSERTTMSVIPFESAGSDLSSNGTANCYLVKYLGEHSFDATVKGNSNEPVGNVKSVKVLWQTLMTNTVPQENEVISDVVLEGGDVVFKANKNGNAGIAVCDADGNILWSWHIWIVEGYEAEASAQTYYNGAGIFMDRNLGALVASGADDASIRGFQYNWGRKDPFRGGQYLFANNGFQWIGGDQFLTLKPDIDYFTRNPMTYGDGYWGDDYSIVHGDWLYCQPAERNQIDTLRWNSVKTKYDPCPPGWRVPDNTLARAAGTSWLDSSPISGGGRNYSGVFGDAADIWYPEGSYWVNHAYVSKDYSDAGFYYSMFANVMQIASSYTNLACGYGINSSLYVRCCDERGVPALGMVEVSDISTNTAKVYADILNDGGMDITDTGIVFSSSYWRIDDTNIFNSVKEMPEDFHVIRKGASSDSINAVLEGLKSNTYYNVRAFAVNQLGYGFGPIASFKTSLSGGNEGVDRGPDINW